MKRKKKNWDQVPWTPFREVEHSVELPAHVKPHHLFVNSIYQVSVWYERSELYGDVAHLSLKTHDKQARHDWREMQRIKNELCGDETEAVELYPAESRLVDTANQYHLFVFKDHKVQLGFQERLVGDGPTENIPHTGRQRPWRTEFRPADVISEEEMEKKVEDFKKPKTIRVGGVDVPSPRHCHGCRKPFPDEHVGHNVTTHIWYCSQDCRDQMGVTRPGVPTTDVPF